MIIYITGGARSGKSAYGQQLARQMTTRPIYVATARIWDDDFEGRIKKHQEDRGETWKCIEEEKYLSRHNFDGQIVMIDCVTLWLTNFFVDTKNNVEESLGLFKSELNALRKQEATFIIISNEIGMGTHAHNEVARKFTDLQGWANQYLASVADQAILMVSGVPVKIKESNASGSI